MANKMFIFNDVITFFYENYPRIQGVVEALKLYSKPYGTFVGNIETHGGTYFVIGSGIGDYRCYIAFSYWSNEGVYKINCENNYWSFKELS